jgi:phage terminase large subunit-like protein
MQATAQRLRNNNIHIEEFPQSSGRLTESSQNLFELIKSQNIILYRDADIRLAMSRAVAKETSRGWRIGKEKQAHKIDVVVALGMAALVAAQQGAREQEPARQYTWDGKPVHNEPKGPHKLDGLITEGPFKGGYATST